MLVYINKEGKIIGYNVNLSQEQAQPWLARSTMAWWLEETYNPPEIPEGKRLELWLDATGRIEYRLVGIPAEEAVNNGNG